MTESSITARAPAQPPRIVFTEKNISGIGGRGKSNSPKTLKSIRDTINKRQQDLDAIAEATGLTATNLSSMFSGAGKNLDQAITALFENKDDLKTIIDEGPFTATNLASMFHGAGARLAEGINALVTHKAALESIIKEGIFTATNLASMFSGAGARLAEGINALVEKGEGGKSGYDHFNDILKWEFTRPDGSIEKFTATNLASMFNGAEARLAEGINALVTHKTDLKTIIDEGIFTASNLASMFHGAGANLGIAIEAVISRQEKITALCQKFEPSQIATKLDTKTAKQLGKAIDEMFEKYQQELNSNTVVPPGAGAAIAATGTAATPARGQGV